MNWKDYKLNMEKYAINTNDMGAEDAYFMATHIPFQNLEVYTGGKTQIPSELMTEDKAFEELICNLDNLHRLIIVRGNNGTGKSHFIRAMKSRFVASPATIYNPNKEKVVFLRRLNNSVRGAFSQLLEQKVIQNQELVKKIQKFIDSSASKTPEEFKEEILYAYATAIATDKSKSVYLEADCRNLSQYLVDSRVKEFMMRDDGAISRCYKIITAPSDTVLKEERIFKEDDFKSREAKKVIRSVQKSGNQDAIDFIMTFNGDDDEISKLVNYLNKFTGRVIQKCADISSETTRSVFEQMRKDLKMQGKNLTIFIEDFTSFTGIDAELITALAAPHTGEYEALCRVTAVIGITDGYFEQFKDNFKDRVTHQISVTEKAYGNTDFLLHMAAKYLNAIYCTPDQIRSWYKEGALLNQIPVSDFKTPCEWEYVEINNKRFTLYPFNKQSLRLLFDQLSEKSPRTFLNQVIKSQLKEYFDGKIYQTEWKFPLNNGLTQMKNAPHSSAIDRDDSIEEEKDKTTNRNRYKNVLALWGDGSASGTKSDKDELFIGNVNKKFFEDIGLNGVQPIGTISSLAEEPSDDSVPIEEVVQEEKKGVDQKVSAETITISQRETAAQKNYRNWKNDIEAWFTKKDKLQYDSDYRTWIKEFLIGVNTSTGAVDWQDLGIPAYIVNMRLSLLKSYYIEDQASDGSEKNSIVCLKRTAETHDVLVALMEHKYAESWEYSGASYYQQKLIVWFERNRKQIVQKLMEANSYDERLPIYKWGFALQFIRSSLYGYTIDTSSSLSIVKSLMKKIDKPNNESWATKEWADVISFVDSNSTKFEDAFNLLIKASNTTMGAVSYSKEPKVFGYHTDELIAAVDCLEQCNWNIADTLPKQNEKNVFGNTSGLLGDMYHRISVVVQSEINEYNNYVTKLETMVGEIKEDNLLEVIGAVQEMLRTFAINGKPIDTALRDRFNIEPKEMSNRILKAISSINRIKDKEVVLQLYELSQKKYRYDGTNDVTALSAINKFYVDLNKIDLLATRETERIRNNTVRTGNDEIDSLADNALQKLINLSETVETMEAKHAEGKN